MATLQSKILEIINANLLNPQFDKADRTTFARLASAKLQLYTDVVEGDDDDVEFMQGVDIGVKYVLFLIKKQFALAPDENGEEAFILAQMELLRQNQERRVVPNTQLLGPTNQYRNDI